MNEEGTVFESGDFILVGSANHHFSAIPHHKVHSAVMAFTPDWTITSKTSPFVFFCSAVSLFYGLSKSFHLFLTSLLVKCGRYDHLVMLRESTFARLIIT